MRGSLMRMWTREVHQEILEQYKDNGEAAKAYCQYNRGAVSRQNVEYWRKVFQDRAGNMAGADHDLMQEREFVVPNPDDDIGDNFALHRGELDRIMVIPDMHAPYQHKDTLAFLREVRDRFKPQSVVCLGDEADYHAMSFHDSDPNLDSAGAELEKAKEFLSEVADEFPRVLVCHSNHGSMVYRRAKAHGIPVQMLKKYRDILFPKTSVPGWSWAFSWKLDTPLGPVMFKHQATSVLTEAAHNACNLVVGHNHGDFKIEYSASSAHLYYGVVSGCLIDKDSLAFAYGKHSVRKPIIGCTMILAGRPVLIPMIMNKQGRWIGSL